MTILIKHIQVCDKLNDSTFATRNYSIELFHPFRPMLAQHAKLDEV